MKLVSQPQRCTGSHVLFRLLGDRSHVLRYGGKDDHNDSGSIFFLRLLFFKLGSKGHQRAALYPKGQRSTWRKRQPRDSSVHQHPSCKNLISFIISCSAIRQNYAHTSRECWEIKTRASFFFFTIVTTEVKISVVVVKHW